ncbi:wall-associated kinase 2 [Hibiscus trionum]|uniref:Wall-associated kinase 2 n=1 Tax=Hibiscus trionum TaxID=183268 RepID=A0A9W7LWI7_HIBTR|nr:wall-associated kinase 2 [Hibiscus trionum]
MAFLCMFIKLTLFAAALTLTATSAASQAKPGCQSHCGGVTIPYPFGTGGSCNLSSRHFIRCDTTPNPAQALLRYPVTMGYAEVQVLHISLDGYVRISSNGDIGSDCYSSSGRVSDSSIGLYWLYDFAISHTRNKFTAIGCDTIAYITSSRIGLNYSTGCLTFCGSVNDVINGSCSGIGCCQTAIPRGMRGYQFNFDSRENHSSVLNFNPCSYGFVVEDGAYNFSVSDLSDTNFNKREFPLVFDWSIGTQNCTEAQRDTQNYACKENSACINPDNNAGYLCKCVDGFQGNPYLGCQDINECETLKLCSVGGTCYNTPGSYSCSCPTGFEGDGWKNGTGCTQTKPRPESFTILLVTLVLGSSLGLLVLIVGVWWLYNTLQRRKNNKLKQKLFERNGGLLFQKKMSSEGGLDKAKLFSSEQLEAATDQYNENRILGRGGQGMVYKGMLPDGRIVAVKKSTTVNESFLEQFINEIVILSQIDHRNVVKLLGCCLETEVPLLVYEFIPNGTLSHFIHDQNEEYPRSWDIRLRIAAEVASAISYLHSSASVPIYHRDIKSSNILLDEKFRAKVSDFGTSRSVNIDQTHLTTQVLGTFGYLDPEYFRSSQFTEKSDVYSFGVVIVELLTGQKAISTSRPEEMRGLVSYFMSAMEENRLLDIVDSEIAKYGLKDEVVAVAQLAQRCLNLDGRHRPTMKEVAIELERLRTRQGDVVPTNQPKQSELFVRKATESWDFTSSSTEHYTNCSITSTSESDVRPLMLDTF